jgi:hypothetical protein
MVADRLKLGAIYRFAQPLSTIRAAFGERERVLSIRYAGASGLKHVFEVIGTSEGGHGTWGAGRILLDQQSIESLADISG